MKSETGKEGSFLLVGYVPGNFHLDKNNQQSQELLPLRRRQAPLLYMDVKQRLPSEASTKLPVERPWMVKTF
jgi:hypothetical protein